MSQYGNIGQLNIEINANAELATRGLEQLANTMKNLTFGNVSGLKEFTKDLKALSKVSIDGNLTSTLSTLQTQISGLNFEVSGLATFSDAMKKLGSKAVDNAINKIPQLATAMRGLFDKLSGSNVIRQDIIDMTKALADFTANGSKVGSASNKIAKGLNKVGKSAQKNKGLIAQFFAGFSAGNFAGNFTANLIAPFMRNIFSSVGEAYDNMLTYASDLVETQNVIERTFGESKNVVEDFSKSALKMYGMNELEAKKMIGTFQAMGTALGETKERMADVSTSMGALVGDYASFFNKEVADVANDFTAIFTGHTKAMRKYGIDLTNAMLQDFADKQGWNVQVKSLSQYNKAIIRYNYLVSRSQDILGDFQRTQGSYANQVKLLSQQFKELFGTLGQVGTAVLTPILQLLNDIVSKIRQFAEQLVAFLGIDNFISISGGAVEGLEDMADGLEDVENSADGSAKALKKLKTYSVGIDELNVLKPNEDKATGGNGLGQDDMQGNWDTDWWDKLTKGKDDLIDFQKTLEYLQWLVTPLAESLKRLWTDGLEPFIQKSQVALQKLFIDYLVPLTEFTLRGVSPIVVDISTNIVQHLTNDLEVVSRMLFRFFDQIKNSGWADAITTTLKNVVAPIIDYIMFAITKGLELAEPFFAFMGGGIAFIGDVLKGLVSEIDLSVIINPLKDMWNTIIEILDKSGLTDKIVKLWDTLKPIGEALGSGIGKALQFILTILGKIFTALSPIIEFLASAVFNGLSAVIDLIGIGLEKIKTPLSIITGFIEKIVGILSSAGKWVADKVTGLIGFFTGGEKEPELNVEVTANTETARQEIENIGTEATIEMTAELQEESFDKVIEDAKVKVDEINTYFNDNGIKITPSIDNDAFIEGFSNTQTIVETKGQELVATASNVGTGMVNALNTTLTNNNPVLTEVITENATVIKTTFEDAKIGLGIKGNTSTVFEEYAKAIVNGFKGGIEKNKGISLNATSVWVKDIMRTFKGNDVEGINYNVWSEYAHQIIQGFADGIHKWSYIAREAIRRWVEEMMSEFEEDMEIESPSKVFKGYGYYTVAGFNQGIKDNQNSSITLVKNWVDDIEKQMSAIENFNVDMSNTIKGLDSLTAKVNTQVDMSGFYGELQKAQELGMNTSLNTYAENRQAIEVNIPNITLEVDSREIARANYRGQKELGYQVRR